MTKPTRRQWRDYATPAGRRPVKEFLASPKLSDGDAAAIVAAMKAVALDGPPAARHLRGDIYEVRADGNGATYRVLFAAEGKFGQVLLALEAISKKSQKTPTNTLALAERRLHDWRSRGKA